MQPLGFTLPLPAFITPLSFLTPKTTTQRPSGDGASCAVTRTSASFHRPPILCRPQDHRAEAIVIRVRLYVAPKG
jgi:hypothetical protein